jgi:alcohol dehydrogenase, propanol-preferring
VDVGTSVQDVRTGATVAVYELIGCGRCTPCRRGEDNLCREQTPGVPGVARDGGLAELVAVPARNVLEIGDLDPVEAARLTDAGMTALHAVERGRSWLSADATAVVIGVGGLGHLAVQYVAATSAARVIAVDVDRSKLEMAERLGAAAGVLADDGADGLLAAAGGRSVDIALDFVGSQQTLDLAAQTVGRGGAIVMTGAGGGRLCITAAIGAGRAPDREVTMIHTMGGTGADLAHAPALAAEGHVRTHVQRFPLEEAERALSALAAGRQLGRAVVVPSR